MRNHRPNIDVDEGAVTRRGRIKVSRRQRTGVLLAAIFFVVLFWTIPVWADTTYVVQRGDTLFRIALRHGLTTSELAQANGIINPDRIYAGQILVIPSLEPDDPDVEVDPAAELEPSLTPLSIDPYSDMPNTRTEQNAAVDPILTTYVVQKGDTLSRIAIRFGVSTQLLASVNALWNPSFIYAGQVLSIPNPAYDGASPGQALPIAPVSYGERWIDVNLTSQRLIAYEDRQPVYSTAISSGMWPWLTVTGLFKIYLRYESQTMDGYRLGYDYYLTNVPYVMYFYRDYAVHGTYWHNNFGTPMSHGCVNTPTPDAQWLYNWSDIGTPVNVHY